MTGQNFLLFLPALHREFAKLFSKNSVMQYACETWRNPVRTAYACYNAQVSYSIRLLTKWTCFWQSFLANNFADFQYSAGKNQDSVQSLVAFGINNICYFTNIDKYWVDYIPVHPDQTSESESQGFTNLQPSKHYKLSLTNGLNTLCSTVFFFFFKILFNIFKLYYHTYTCEVAAK